MGKQSTVDYLCSLFEESCIDIFERLGCSVCRTDSNARISMNDPVGVLDAGSDELELTILLELPVNVVALTYPDTVDIVVVEEEKLEDWTAELSNQLLGNLKNKLLRHDLCLNMGLPGTYFGLSLEELSPADGEQVTYCFAVDKEVMEATLVIDIKQEGLDLSLDSAHEDDGPGEGELELF